MSRMLDHREGCCILEKDAGPEAVFLVKDANDGFSDELGEDPPPPPPPPRRGGCTPGGGVGLKPPPKGGGGGRG